MYGVDIDASKGAAQANDLIAAYRPGIDRLVNGETEYNPKNKGFNPLDAAILYAMIRRNKPRRIVEIGSGMSTVVILSAIRDGRITSSLTCIEPYLPDYLEQHRDEITEIIEKPLQEVSPDLFTGLERDDVLFIDSTHVVRFDSDVVYEVLEILPQLKEGVIVHVHDIFFPDNYPENWLTRFRYFWAEQYMLQAFLCMNHSFKIEVPLHAVKNLVSLENFLENDETPTGSLWMRRV